MEYTYKKPRRIGIKGYDRNNCTMTAIGNALNLSYDLAKKILQSYMWISIGREKIFFRKKDLLFKCEFTEFRHVQNVCSGLAEETIRIKEGTSLLEFKSKYNVGLYLVLVEGHLTVVSHGEIIDTWNSSEREVMFAYRLNKHSARELIKPIAEFYKMDNEFHMPEETLNLKVA